MKKLIILLTAAVVVLASSTGCKKQPKDLLPPPTQEGKNILGALIDGNLYFAKNNYKGNPMFFCNSYVKWNEGGLGGIYISTEDCEANNYSGMYIYINREDIVEGGTYEIGSIDIEGIKINFRGSNPLLTYYNSDQSNKGSITFTKYNDNIVAGTFKSQAIGYHGADSGKVIQVTDGRFDIKR